MPDAKAVSVIVAPKSGVKPPGYSWRKLNLGPPGLFVVGIEVVGMLICPTLSRDHVATMS